MTVKDLIESSLRLIGVFNASPEELESAKTTLSDMLESWSIDRDFAYTTTDTNISISPGLAAYQLPTCQSLEYVRYVINDELYDVDIINRHLYNTLPNKSARLEYSTHVFEDSGWIYLYPTPDKKATLQVTTKDIFAGLSSINATLNLTPGVLNAVRVNLAALLAPEYGKAAPIIPRTSTPVAFGGAVSFSPGNWPSNLPPTTVTITTSPSAPLYRGYTVEYMAHPFTDGYEASDHTILWTFADGSTATTNPTEKLCMTPGNIVTNVRATNIATGGIGKAKNTIKIKPRPTTVVITSPVNKSRIQLTEGGDVPDGDVRYTFHLVCEPHTLGFTAEDHTCVWYVQPVIPGVEFNEDNWLEIGTGLSIDYEYEEDTLGQFKEWDIYFKVMATAPEPLDDQIASDTAQYDLWYRYFGEGIPEQAFLSAEWEGDLYLVGANFGQYFNSNQPKIKSYKLDMSTGSRTLLDSMDITDPSHYTKYYQVNFLKPRVTATGYLIYGPIVEYLDNNDLSYRFRWWKVKLGTGKITTHTSGTKNRLGTSVVPMSLEPAHLTFVSDTKVRIYPKQQPIKNLADPFTLYREIIWFYNEPLDQCIDLSADSWSELDRGIGYHELDLSTGLVEYISYLAPAYSYMHIETEKCGLNQYVYPAADGNNSTVIISLDNHPEIIRGSRFGNGVSINFDYTLPALEIKSEVVNSYYGVDMNDTNGFYFSGAITGPMPDYDTGLLNETLVTECKWFQLNADELITFSFPKASSQTNNGALYYVAEKYYVAKYTLSTKTISLLSEYPDLGVTPVGQEPSLYTKVYETIQLSNGMFFTITGNYSTDDHYGLLYNPDTNTFSLSDNTIESAGMNNIVNTFTDVNLRTPTNRWVMTEMSEMGLVAVLGTNNYSDDPNAFVPPGQGICVFYNISTNTFVS